MKAFAYGLMLTLIAGLLWTQQSVSQNQAVNERPAPEFSSKKPSDWINSTPLSMQSLRGKVVLLDFWTFDCWNCYRSFPWLNDLEQRLSGEDFRVIGIHTPEFEHEKVLDNVKAKVKEFKLHHPVMLDNNFRYWNAMENRYWPAYYLIDKKGMVRARFIGETHKATDKAKKIEDSIRFLLRESS